MLRSRHSLLTDQDGRGSFEPQEFLVEGFSVDEFIQNKRTRVPLDVLRDDLGTHLKFLRSSLIELINQDYGQFVNLSSNLVGLDGRIQNIAGPLQKAKNDLNVYVESLDSTIDSLKSELDLKKKIRQTKKQLQLHRMVLLAAESSEKHMRRVPEKICSELDFHALSSTCEEVANAQFLLRSCLESPMSNDVKNRLTVLMEEALSRMNSLLITHSLKSSVAGSLNSESIVIKLLHLYVELQKVSDAENIFISNVLKPVCDEILSKKGNVSSLLDGVENFIVDSPTIKVSRQLEDYVWMSNYNFLSNCVLPHVLEILKKHFPHIWSPSNPDTFHSNWMRCERFITFSEEMMPSIDHLQAFRNSESLKDFLSKWQFPVYFQLRFHSLAVELESALEDVSTMCANSDFKLDCTRAMIKVLKQCWDVDKIYIDHISGRFLKASALIVSRYINALEKEVSSSENESISVLLNVYCDLKLAELIVQQLIIEKLSSQLSNYSLQDTRDTDRPANLCLTAIPKSFFADFKWEHLRSYIEKRLVQITTSKCLSSISLVTEVPRLYRRTNRELPTKHGEYVEGIVHPLSSLKETVTNCHQGDLWENIGSHVGTQVSQRYKAQVEEVLTSVLRMEESLKRLKKVKGQHVSGAESNKVLSDDDKIRKQIQIDITFFVMQINSLCPTVDTTSLLIMFDQTNGNS